MNIYEILTIPPTGDFRIIKKAYLKKALELHPDKWGSASTLVRDQKQEEFKVLISAYEQVNSEEKLTSYYNRFKNGFFDNQPNFNNNADAFDGFSHASSNFTTEPSNALRVPKQGLVDIFIPVPIADINSSHDEDEDIFTLPKLNESEAMFASKFDFNKLASVLNAKSKQRACQIGVTFDEAKDIVNQHSNRNFIIIVQVKVDLNRLYDNKMSEKDVYGPTVLNSGSTEYLYLLEATHFSPDNIILVKPMTFDNCDYENSIRIEKPRDLALIWPKDLTVKNVLAIKHSIDQKSPFPPQLLPGNNESQTAPVAPMSIKSNIHVNSQSKASSRSQESVTTDSTQGDTSANSVDHSSPNPENFEISKKNLNSLLNSYIVKREAVTHSSGQIKRYFYGDFFSNFQKSYREKKDAVSDLQRALNGENINLSQHLATLRNGTLGKELRKFVKSGLGDALVDKKVNTVREFVQALHDKCSYNATTFSDNKI